MAHTDKDLIISPSIGSTTEDPRIDFKGASATVGPSTITVRAYPTNNGTLSFEGSSGQLFSIVNTLNSGSIFSVNDISGIPLIDVDANATVKIGVFGGNTGIGSTTPTSKLDVVGGVKVLGVVTATSFSGDVGYARTAGIATYAPNAGVATYAGTAGIATVAASATYAQTSGISTISGISTYSQTSGIATYSSSSGVSTYASTAGIATVAVGLGTTSSINTTGIITASKFVGDGSGLSGIVASGSGIEIRDSGSLVGTAATIDFGDYLDVNFGSGIATVTAIIPAGSGASDWVRTGAGIHTLGNVGVGTTNPKVKLQINGVLGFGTVFGYAYSSTNVLIGDEKTGSSLTPQVTNSWFGLNNILIGSGTGAATTTGNSNIFMGMNAGHSNTSGYYNNFFGLYAGCSNTIGHDNNFIGNYTTGINNTSGTHNNFMGYGSGQFNTVGSYNNFIGDQSGHYNTTGIYNDFLGYRSGWSNTTGCENIFYGKNSGYSNSTGRWNVFIGSHAGYHNTTGDANTSMGYCSGGNNITGKYNAFFGNSSGYSNQDGSYNVFFGGYTGTTYDRSFRVIIGSGKYQGSHFFDSPKDADKQFAVGLNTTGTTEYWLVGDENFNIGIGTTNPSEKLSVGGNILLNQTTLYGSVQASTASTVATGIHSGLSTSVYRSVEYTIQASEGSNYQAIKILAIHNGTNAYDTQYGNIYNTEVAAFDVDISGGNVRLVATASSTSTTNYTINFIATRI